MGVMADAVFGSSVTGRIDDREASKIHKSKHASNVTRHALTPAKRSMGGMDDAVFGSSVTGRIDDREALHGCHG